MRLQGPSGSYAATLQPERYWEMMQHNEERCRSNMRSRSKLKVPRHRHAVLVGFREDHLLHNGTSDIHGACSSFQIQRARHSTSSQSHSETLELSLYNLASEESGSATDPVGLSASLLDLEPAVSGTVQALSGALLLLHLPMRHKVFFPAATYLTIPMNQPPPSARG